jgi:protein TonB
MSAVLLEAGVGTASAQAGPLGSVLYDDADHGPMTLQRAWLVSLVLTVLGTVAVTSLRPAPLPEPIPPRHVMHAMLVEQPPPIVLPPEPPPPPKAQQPQPKPEPAPVVHTRVKPVQPVVQPVLAPTLAPAVEAPVVPAPPAEPVAATPAPAPPQPPAKPVLTGKVAIGVVCPTQVKPVMPMAARQAGISGVVKARAVVRAGRVTDVQILEGPKIFHAAVKAAMSAYQCDVNAQEATAEQEFVFQLD